MFSQRRPEHGVPPIHQVGRIVGLAPIWLESRAVMENRRLRDHPVFTGDGLPHGGGEPVMLIPGFMGGDRSLATLQGWLLRMGYHVETAGITLNVRYSESVLSTILLRLADLYGWLGLKVALVGHSRGGILAKVASHRNPEMVSRVVALGSPLADPYDISVFTMACVRLAQAYNLARFGMGPSVELQFLRDLAAPARTPLMSIYSRSDAIVHWRACIRPDAECLEVTSSHVGLAVNPGVYAALAGLLASSRPPRQRRASATPA